MPLIPTAIETPLDTAFKASRNKFKISSRKAFLDAMTKFKTESENAAKVIPPNKDGIFGTAVEAASDVFMNEMDKAYGDTFEGLGKIIAAQVDAYIRTMTIIVPPGQVVLTPFAPAPLPGSTTAPSLPAIIS